MSQQEKKTMTDDVMYSHFRGQQTLAAIAFSDVVGFSARMGKDEVHTLELVDRDFHKMTACCQKYEGKVLKSLGDGLLMYFASAVQAVACAYEIQNEFAGNAIALPANDVLEHRIGIHLGDVFFNDVDVMGNGVNIAARLQSQSEVGGICISQTVYDVVKNRLDLEVAYLGELKLKNIQDAIAAYQILLPLAKVRADSAKLQNRNFKPTKISEAKKLTKQEYRYRQILLNKVRVFWIEGILETSLYGKALIELGLQTRLDVLEHPWQIDWATPEDARRPLPIGTKAINQFDRLGMGRTLLILGEPGAGKTTTLLEITRELVARAETDAEQATPVVFNLFSWQDGQRLAEWLVQELDTKYQVPKKISQNWINEQQLLPMLDGLDEVSVERRNACVEAINQFHNEFRETEIVTCSRIQDYEALTKRLQFQGAIFIQPLSETQIYQYFEHLGSELEGVREMMQTDAQLLELAKSPLMVNIMAIAYRGMSVTDLIRLSLTDNHVQYLFDTYIDRMLKRRPSKQYSADKTKRWLHWLSMKMFLNSQSIFLIERLQPEMLQHSSQRWFYRLGVGIITGILFGILFALMYSVVFALPVFSAIASPRFQLLSFDELFGEFEQILPILVRGSGLTILVIALISTVYNAFQGLMDEIKLIERLRWSLKRIIVVAGISMIIGIFVSPWLALSLSISIVLSIGQVSSEIETKVVANQGVWRTLSNTQYLILLLLWNSAISIGIIYYMFSYFFWIKVIDGVEFWAFYLCVGTITGLVWVARSQSVFAGIAVIQHFVLRVILWANGCIPWNYARFLNYATNCILLQKVGGGYVFIHRSLLEHFTALPINQYNYKTSTANTSIFASPNEIDGSNLFIIQRSKKLQNYGGFLVGFTYTLIVLFVGFVILSVLSGDGTPTECTISTESQTKQGIVKTAKFASGTDCEVMRELAEKGLPLPTIVPVTSPP
jgi:class 3 adenylate cyclase/DNA polymerase III delta prime subunit